MAGVSPVEEALTFFLGASVEFETIPLSTGHINSTFLARARGARLPKYILQRINTNVFRDPDALMENIRRVTDHLAAKAAADGLDPDNECLVLVRSGGGRVHVSCADGSVWRMYRCVPDAVSIKDPSSPADACQAGEAFGRFQARLVDLPGALHDTIPRFHDVDARLAQFHAALRGAEAARAGRCAAETAAVLSRAERYRALFRRYMSLPRRTTHNDTKFSNVLLDVHSARAVCVIDLDTVMSAVVPFDFGDGVRSGAGSAAEDEIDADRMGLDMEKFRAFAEGYLRRADFLTAEEIDSLVSAGSYMSYLIGLRFLADYLSGDRYFRVSRPEHNLHRARTQLALLADLEARENDLVPVVRAGSAGQSARGG